MTTKQHIEYGEKLFKENKETVERLIRSTTEGDDKETLALIAAHIIQDLSRKLDDITARLDEYRKKHEREYEFLSRDANLYLDALLKKAWSYRFGEPLDITQKVKDIVEGSPPIKELTQEQRNKMYIDLRGHLDFLEKTYKRNA